MCSIFCFDLINFSIFLKKIDTDLAFDIIEPIEQMDEVKEKLELDKPIKDSVNNEEYKFYDLTIEDPNIHLLVEVHTLKGDTSINSINQNL